MNFNIVLTIICIAILLTNCQQIINMTVSKKNFCLLYISSFLAGVVCSIIWKA